ncbi:cytochrome oxidase putative small subunit CydP [Thiobacter aerophilum]|uniref:Cytochrome oxidase putative small subunit CydP n=1 Tax=Thiobacter aerophilum TaxID=3121275 RepID=A0ABV0EHF3_9BURK
MKIPRNPLVLEIAVALVVKLALIAGLYFAFFSGGTAKPDAEAIARHLTVKPAQ